MSWRRSGLAALAALSGLGAAAAPAAADVVAGTARANAGFLDVAPAPPVDVPICVIDSGYSGDDPNVQKVSVIGTDGADGDPSRHGTHMVDTARRAFPAGRVISVRVVAQGSSTSRSMDSAKAVEACLSLRAGVISFSRSSADANEGLAAQVRKAVALGVNFVASAGNMGHPTPGPPRFPASLDESFAVAASGRTGNRCRFSNGTPEAPVNLTAPGCDSAWPWDDYVSRGTSPAAAATAAWLAALRSYHPGLSASGAETALSSTGKPTSIGPAVNVAAAFAAVPGILDAELPPAPQIRKVRLGKTKAVISVVAITRPARLVSGDIVGRSTRISIPLQAYRSARLAWRATTSDGTPVTGPRTRLPRRAG